jgi:two-component system, cell cycle sensor histidine kinase and response regulator CckA
VADDVVNNLTGSGSSPSSGDLSVRASARALAHDFNNLLSAILGHASYLRLLAPPGSEMDETAATIEASAERAKALTQKLYELSTGKESVVEARLDLHGLIREVAATLAPTQAGAAPLVLELEATHSQVRGDSTQLNRLLMNLAVNAREAVGPGGAEIEIRTTDTAAGLRLEVADGGPGIRPEDRRHLFEPNFSTKPGGKGLGLAIVDKIARWHGAQVEVDDNQPRGAIFRITFPRA